MLEDASMAKLPINLRLQKKLLKGFTAAEKRLIFSLKKESVQVILAEYGITAAESLHSIKYLKIPIVVHFHGYDASRRDIIKSYGSRYLDVFDYAHSVIVVSHRMKRDLIDLGCPESKIILNPYGPNEQFFALKPIYDSQQFLSVGRFVEKKAPHLTILAFKKVLSKFPKAKLKMVGDGVLWNLCKELLIHLGLSNNIELIGSRTVNEVQTLMEQSLAFVQHSVIAPNGDSEGTPVAVLEAQAAGLPVISTYHAGIPDVVINGKTGLLCQEHDIDAMAANMMNLLNTPSFAKQMGMAGRKRVNENFSIEKHLKILAFCINNAIGKEA